MLLAGTLSCLTIYLVWPLLAKRSLDRVVRSSRENFFAADVSAMYADAPRWEREYLRLDSSQLARLEKEFLRPKLSGISFVRVATTGVDKLAGTAEELVKVQLPDGTVTDLLFVSTLTDDGPKTSFTHMLARVWTLEYLADHPKATINEALAYGWSTGLERDVPLLEDIGIMGLPPKDPASKPTPWPEVKEQATKLVQVMRSRARS